MSKILGVTLDRLLDPDYLPPAEWEDLERDDRVKKAERSLEEIEAAAVQHEVSRQEGTLGGEKEKQMTPEQLNAIRSRIKEVEDDIQACHGFIARYEEIDPSDPDIPVERECLRKLETELKGLRA